MTTQKVTLDPQERETGTAIFWIVTIGALVLGAIAVGYSVQHESKHSKIIEALGEALVIAGFLSLTVDRYVKHKLIEEVSRDVAKLIFGYQLPPGAEATFKDLMLGWRVIREDLAISWKIVPVPSSDKLNVTVAFSFTVRNFGNSKETYKQSVFAEDHDTPTITHLKCVKIQPGKKDETIYDYTPANIKVDKSDRGVQKAFGEEISIKPYAKGKGPSYNVSASYSMVLPPEYSDVFAFGGPTSKVSIVAEIDPATNIVFMAEDTEDGSEAPWSYDQFYLPKQYLRVRWYKGSAAHAAPANPAAAVVPGGAASK